MDGHRKRLSLTLEHRDAYRAMAIAIAPCVLGLLDGSIKKPGVHMMGHVLDPEQYMEDMWSLGMTVSLQGLPATWDKKSRPSECRPDQIQTDDIRAEKTRPIGQVA
jgi:hypothetical protein